MNQVEYEKLPKMFKKKWLKALRSGKYKQAKSTLFGKEEPIGYDKHGNEKLGKAYCCLGVACHIQGIQNREFKGATLITGGIGRKALEKRVPKILIGIIDKKHEEEDEVYNPLVKKLAGMNDAKRSSFEKIADWIEENL